MSKITEKARAKVGATLLDVLRPGWASEINTTTLDLSSCDVCVLGQLFGKYGTGAEKLFAVAAKAPFREGSGWMDDGIETASANCGFVGTGNKNGEKRGIEYRKLTEAWRREIAKRLPITAKVPYSVWVAAQHCGTCNRTPCHYDSPTHLNSEGGQTLTTVPDNVVR